MSDVLPWYCCGYGIFPATNLASATRNRWRFAIAILGGPRPGPSVMVWAVSSVPVLQCSFVFIFSSAILGEQVPVFQPNGPAELQCEYFFSVLGWALEGEFLEGEFFRGPLLLENTGSKNSTQEFGSKSRAPKIRFAEFGPEFGFRRCNPENWRKIGKTQKKNQVFPASFGLFSPRFWISGLFYSAAGSGRGRKPSR